MVECGLNCHGQNTRRSRRTESSLDGLLGSKTGSRITIWLSKGIVSRMDADRGKEVSRTQWINEAVTNKLDALVVRFMSVSELRK